MITNKENNNKPVYNDEKSQHDEAVRNNGTTNEEKLQNTQQTAEQVREQEKGSEGNA